MNTRLLIVDDQPNARELIRGFLDMPGITFQECASGHDAVTRAREFKPHWVTMDIKMPGMDGFETTRAIKEAHPEARVLIVTSFNDPHFRNLAHSVGAAGFILKENLLALRLMLEQETKNISEPVPVPINFDQATPPAAKRILVLDDDKEMRTIFELLQADEGFRITQAYNADEALSLHRENPFDLVIVELLLPNNEGFEALTELRRMNPAPKFIATARSSWMPVEIYSKMAKQLGVQGTLGKPFSSEQMLATVRQVLEL
jgi:CheY-like chemotaxis protein